MDVENALCRALLRETPMQSANCKDQSGTNGAAADDECQIQDLYFRPDIRQGMYCDVKSKMLKFNTEK